MGEREEWKVAAADNEKERPLEEESVRTGKITDEKGWEVGRVGEKG